MINSSNQTISLLVSWHVERDTQGNIFMPYTHFSYLEYVLKIYNEVYLVAPIFNVLKSSGNFYQIGNNHLHVIALPPYTSFLSAQVRCMSFIKAIRSLNTDIIYCRVPDPFSWLPSLLTSKKVIMHFVGDTIDATRKNEEWSLGRKWVMIAAYMPDYLLTLCAARKSKVYTNGYHLKDKLLRKGINSVAVISSTVAESDLHEPLSKLPKNRLTFCYVGYLRYAKGIHTLMRLIERLHDEKIDFIFNIVGEGEMMVLLQTLVTQLNVSDNVILYGHIDNRDQLNSILRNSDLFIFPSLSEGSPRVVIEAMAQGVPVVATPVGSLPTTFSDGENIHFFDFQNDVQLLNIIKRYIEKPLPFIEGRDKAYEMVKCKYTKESFLRQIFSYE